MALAVPAASEAALANQPVAARIAVMIDLLLGLLNGGVTAGNPATPQNISSGSKANTIVSAVLPAVAGKTTYITGFEVTGSGATAGLPVTVTVSGGTWTLSYTYTFATGVLVSNQPLVVFFPTPIPASAANTAITVSCPASGAGGTNNTVNAHGFTL